MTQDERNRRIAAALDENDTAAGAVALDRYDRGLPCYPVLVWYAR